jgi:hypothetical protein
MLNSKRWINIIFQIAALILALLFTSLILMAVGAPPLQAYQNILAGAFGSWDNISNVLVAWVPLLLTTAGLLITFAAGLWNIGVEGQIVLGAIGTTWVLRLLQDSSWSPALILILAILAGMIGGALWAALAGVLKTFGGVNEIFGGLGLPRTSVVAADYRFSGQRLGFGFGDCGYGDCLLSPAGHVFRSETQSCGQEHQSRLPVGCSHLAVSDALIRLVRHVCRCRRCYPGDGGLPPPDPFNFEWLWLVGAAGGHADQLPGDLGRAGSFVLCSP